MKKKFNLTSVGGSSILTIFGVLMLIVFALLSLSTAKADRNLADRTWQAKEAYYKADREAEEILGRLRAGEVPEGVTKNGKQYSYKCSIDDNQQLQVVVEISGKDYRIKQWEKVYTGDWQGITPLRFLAGCRLMIKKEGKKA